jgi:glycosyltransferase involved in cell wall biosynthesis
MTSSIGAAPNDNASAAWPVMVLAHNEERQIVACLDSIFAADPGVSLKVFVMANGCTDRTEQLVRDYARRDPRVVLISIEMGDKCNAWNVFVHDTVPAACPGRDIYFFMDGDARVLPGSFSAMRATLDDQQQANAVGAPPASGRSMARDRDELIRDRGLVANLYALRGTFVARCRALGVRLPLRLEGDDGVIGALVRWDLNPTQAWNAQLIAPCPQAGFTFESFNMSNPAQWKAYWRRIVRYGRRRYEFALLRERLKAGGMSAMPRDIRSIYDGAARLRVTWNGLYTITNWFALREMRRLARASANGN